MMYETEAGSGEYVVASDTVWPGDNYVFNEQLSSCENGSTLTWDNENKSVILNTSLTDKCYVYFDRDYSLTVDNVSIIHSQSSLVINVSATSEGGEIVSYHYSIDDGNSYTTSANNSYTFNSLLSGTTYYIKVYVTDSNGKTSNIYSTSATTSSGSSSGDVSILVSIVDTATDSTNVYSVEEGLTWYEWINSGVDLGRLTTACNSSGGRVIYGVFDNSGASGYYLYDSNNNLLSGIDVITTGVYHYNGSGMGIQFSCLQDPDLPSI